MPEWPKGTDCKSVAERFGGSNPPLPTSQDGGLSPPSASRPHSSEAEHFFGKEEVLGPIPSVGWLYPKNRPSTHILRQNDRAVEELLCRCRVRREAQTFRRFIKQFYKPPK